MSDNRQITQQCAQANLHRALSLFIGRGRKHSVADIEAGTGISARTVSSWTANSEENRRNPTFADILVIADFLGGEDGRDGAIFMSNALEGTPYGAHVVERHVAPATDVITTLSNGSAAFLEAGIDHVFDHQEKARLKPWADKMIAILKPFSSHGAHNG